MSDVITSRKLDGGGGGKFVGQAMLFGCMGICVLSPARECEVRGSYVQLLIVKYLSHPFCLNSATVYQSKWTCRGFFSRFLKPYLEDSIDHIIFRD